MGSVTFPLAFEGPPGIVHGGVLATFFDCAIQHHNCDVGVAGKTMSLLVEYHRPTPLMQPLTFEIEREVTDSQDHLASPPVAGRRRQAACAPPRCKRSPVTGPG